MISIGEFSKICAVTTKTLRYYDEINLIKPDFIAESGYRYYRINQLKDMLFINKLKNYGFSLEEIAAIISQPTEEDLLYNMKKKEQQLKQQMDDFAELLEKMQTDITKLERGIPIMNDTNTYEIKLVEREPENILYSRQIMSTEEFGKYIGKLFQIIAKEHLTVTGDVMSIYHNPEFTPESSDIEIAIPIKEVVTGTRDLPGGLFASLSYKGVYSDLGLAYSKLMEWIDAEGYETTGTPFEIYRNSPNEQNPKEQVTDIYMPIRKK